MLAGGSLGAFANGEVCKLLRRLVALSITPFQRHSLDFHPHLSLTVPHLKMGDSLERMPNVILLYHHVTGFLN